jgi:hypothetical protein
VERTLEGYQRLDQDFFRLCIKRGIKGESRTLFLYLRGLYCFFGKPAFYCPDKNIMEDLALSRMTVNRARKTLRQRGVIEYKTFEGRGRATEYLILKTELAPIIKGNKMSPFLHKMLPFNGRQSSTKRSQNVTSIVIKRVNKEALAIKDVEFLKRMNADTATLLQ